MFVGRKTELDKLNRLYDADSFQMVVVYGRRRVGKTALISEFGRSKRTLYFTALDQSDKDNLSDFSNKIGAFFNLPQEFGSLVSWEAAFEFIARKAAEERFVLIFDEFPYAAAKNEALPSVLQIAIDHSLKNTGLFLILCGSDQGFMESEVLGRKSPLYGRRTAQLKVGPLGYREAAEMLPGLDPQEWFKYYGCIGGVPYYLEQVNTRLSFEENLRELYFDSIGFLYDEPYGLLRQEFREPALYNSILRAVASGANKPHLIADRMGIEQTVLPRYLSSLVRLGIVERSVPFGEGERSKRAVYRICDPCFAFWFRFVMPNISAIEQGLGGEAVRRLRGERLDDYLGHRFELLCQEWVLDQAREGALPLPVMYVGSWWGTDPMKREQTDLDVVAADPDSKRLILGECKYRESFDESAELDDLESKRDLIKGYHATELYLFTKHACSEGTLRRVAASKDLHAVTIDMMYR